jgi:hypothetical protein
MLLFTSCSENSEGLTDTSDATIIESIENSARIVVADTDVPASLTTAFDGDYIDSSIKTVELAAGLGFKVTTLTDNAERAESESDVFFTTEGRALTDRRDETRRRRSRCFEFVFPINFIMPDATSLTLESADDWVLIREWYAANPDSTERPDLVFPVDVTLEDGTLQTLVNIDELKDVKSACRKGKNKRKCFKLVLPVSFTMPDASVITVTERSDFFLIRAWHMANPDVEEKKVVNYPVDVMYRDDTVVTINDQIEMDAAKEACRD